MTKRETPDVATMQAVPQAEHQWLQRFVGEWTYEGEATMEPGTSSMKFTGSASVRSLGGLWFVSEESGAMPDGSIANMILTLGYDPAKGHYVGTWIGSMMPYLWLYEGALDASGKILTLDSVGPNMAVPGTMASFKDEHAIISDDHRVLTSRMLGDDGNWRVLMTVHYRRKA